MNRISYIISSIRHYRRTHMGILAGSILAALVVSTSLQIGSSVRGTLLDLVRSKLQSVRLAAMTGENTFGVGLADRLRQHQSEPIATAFLLRGAAIGTDNRRINAVQVWGVDPHFFTLGTAPAPPVLPEPFTCYINRAVADKLKVTVEDELVLRMEKPGLIPGDAPLSIQDSRGLALRLTVTRIISAEEMGDVSLRNDTARPFNVFVNRTWLSEKLEQAGKANLLLSSTPADQIDGEQKRLGDMLKLEDVGLKLNSLQSGQTELVTEQVFLADHIASSLKGSGRGVFTYFANSLSANGYSTPYFFVSGSDEHVPDGLTSGDIVITQWLADDLGLKPGDQTEMAYFALKAGGGLTEITKTFTVHSIIPTADRRDLMPAFPGMAEADSCSEWDPGLPVDLKKIRQKDEDYWDAYNGSPKAFVSLATAQELWHNRFGQLTSIRFDEPMEIVRNRVTAAIEPDDFGLSLTPIYQQRIKAGSGGVDFGGLFIGLSFFIIVAALILVSMLFAFSLQQRRQEVATMLALGFTRSRIYRLFILEGSLLAVLGGLIGATLAIPLNRIVIQRISTVWSGTVSSMTIDEHLSIVNLIIGASAGVIMAVFSLWLAGRRLFKDAASVRSVYGTFGPLSMKGFWIMALIFGGTAVGLGVMSSPSSGKDVAMYFMGSGFCALLAMIGFYGGLLGYMSRWQFSGLGYLKLLVQGLASRRGRSLAVVGTMAIGLFLIAGVAANRHDPLKSENTTSSGTGGYTFYAEASVPIMDDLNAAKSRQSFNLSVDAQFLQMKHRPGADASCLNLSKVLDPSLLAVNPKVLAERNAFSFSAAMEGAGSPWMLLEKPFDDGAIPVIADNNVILWSLGKGIGDDLVVMDESGKPITLRFVAGLKNSIFQGWVIMSTNQFSQHFPAKSGSTVFLIDAPSRAVPELREAFKDSGFEIAGTNERLAMFNRVEATYLEIFLALGGLGLLIGTIGLGIVVSRNILERRQELGIMQAYGFTHTQLSSMIFIEHSLLLIDGLIIGGLAAWIAILPALKGKTGDVPLAELGLQFTLILTMGFLCIWLGCRFAMRGDLNAALRNE